MVFLRTGAEWRTWTRPALFVHLVCCFASVFLNHGADSESRHEPSALLRSLSLPQHTEYEIVSPYEVDYQGVYISHKVAHHQRRRRRRSLTPHAGSWHTDGGSETVHFRLSGLGRDFHMELREASHSLIAPGFTIQVLGGNGTRSRQEYHRDDLCFYQGSLRSKVNTSVALSTCMGMVSMHKEKQLGMRRSQQMRLVWVDVYLCIYEIGFGA